MTPEEIKKMNDLFSQIDALTAENTELAGKLDDKKSKATDVFNDMVIALNARVDELNATLDKIDSKIDAIQKIVSKRK